MAAHTEVEIRRTIKPLLTVYGELNTSEEKRPFIITRKSGKKANKSDYKRFTNVWTDINELEFGSSPQKFSSFRDFNHFTPKPVELIERIVKLHTKGSDLVLDCFAGSGTTGVACKRLNRNFILIEKEKEYYDIIHERLEKKKQYLGSSF